MVLQLTEAQSWAIGAAVAFMCMDMLTGFIGAVINKCVSSSKMREGIGHKALLCCVIAVALMVEVASQHVAGLDLGGVTVEAVCAYIVLMELASIMENVCGAYPELRDTPLMRVFEHAGEARADGDARG